VPDYQRKYDMLAMLTSQNKPPIAGLTKGKVKDVGGIT
jgi:hypothetical protein